MDRAVRQRSMMRTEILCESRETMRKSHPSLADAAQWIHAFDTQEDGHTPEMETFASLVDGSDSRDFDGEENTSTARRMRCAARENLRGYLRNYLRNSLQLRDIRQLDPAFAAKSALWVRHTALVFSMENVRAIIFRTKALLFQPDLLVTKEAADYARKLVAARVQAATPAPFEQCALEALLIHVVGSWRKNSMFLGPQLRLDSASFPGNSPLRSSRLQRRNWRNYVISNRN